MATRGAPDAPAMHLPVERVIGSPIFVGDRSATTTNPSAHVPVAAESRSPSTVNPSDPRSDGSVQCEHGSSVSLIQTNRGTEVVQRSDGSEAIIPQGEVCGRAQVAIPRAGTPASHARPRISVHPSLLKTPVLTGIAGCSISANVAPWSPDRRVSLSGLTALTRRSARTYGTTIVPTSTPRDVPTTHLATAASAAASETSCKNVASSDVEATGMSHLSDVTQNVPPSSTPTHVAAVSSSSDTTPRYVHHTASDAMSHTGACAAERPQLAPASTASTMREPRVPRATPATEDSALVSTSVLSSPSAFRIVPSSRGGIDTVNLQIRGLKDLRSAGSGWRPTRRHAFSR